MRSLSSNYVSGANGNIRNVNVTIKDINDSVLYTASQILSVSIQKSITDGSVGIGFTQSDRLYLQVISDHKVPKMTWLRVYISIDGSPDVSFGRFVTEECVRDGSAITITAFDAMYYQSAKTVKFTGAPSLHLEPLSFPCSMQDMLDYICTLRNMTTEFTCQSFTVQQMPQKGGNQYYSVRELIGFIAACHGCNAKLDASNHLVFKQFETVNYSASAADVLDLTIDDSEPFEITGVLFTVDTETSIYIDDVPGSEYDEDDVGVISCYNPLATVEIAEYVWTQIGGLSYYGGSLTQRGKGIIEVGDVITVGNLKYPADTETYPLCVTSIDYSITADGGFVETLGSDAAKSSDQMSSGTNGSSGGAGGTGKFLDAGHTSVAHNDTEHNTSEGTYDSVDGYYNTITGSTSKANTVTGEYNTVTTSKDNIVSGNNNTVTASNNCNVSGMYNTVIQCDRSVFTGMSGQYTNCYSLLAVSNGNMRVNNATRALLVGSIYGAWVDGAPQPSGGQIYETTICGNGIEVTTDVAYSAIFGTSHTIGGNTAFAVAVFGQSHKIMNNPNSTLVSGARHTVSGEWRSIIAGEENIAQNGGHNIVTGQNNTVTSASCCSVFGQGHSVQSAFSGTIVGQYGQLTSGKMFVVGNGWSPDTTNIFEVDNQGNVTASGTITPGGGDYSETYEWLDGNPDTEDRRGLFVTLDGKYIKLATSEDDYILGVVSATPSISGDTYDAHWKGKYKKDIFGALIYGKDGHPIISDDYDPELKYIPQSERKEKDKVGTHGKLVVVDDGTCVVNKYCKPSVGGIGTYTDDKNYYRVLERLDDTHIKIVIK